MQVSEANVLTVEAAQGEFSPEVIFLNTATMGLPPRRTLDALRAALDVWASGRANAVAYDDAVARARDNYAHLVGVDASLVAQGSQASVFAGLIAASLPDNAEVLTASGDFTSVVFPFHVQARRGIRVCEVPLEELPGAVTNSTTLVALSAVQSADGRVADLDALTQACAATDTKIMLDTTQAAGWLPIDAGRFAYTICHGYKWLLAPRGTAFLTIQRELLDGIAPHTAGWYAGADRWNSIYGAPLRLAADARRFDVSPAWLSWVGADASLALLCEVGRETLHRHAVGLANRFRAGVGIAPSNSAIVSMLADDQVPELMRTANIVGVTRAGRLRLSFHVSTSAHDAHVAIEALSGHVRM
jgi:selenocysteine lyase/cysteine desulfurase